MLLSPISFISSSFAVLLLLLVLTPFLRLNQRLLITVGFSLTTIASLLATAAGIWTVASGITLPGHRALRACPICRSISGSTSCPVIFSWSSACSPFLCPSTPSGMSRDFWATGPVTSLVVFYALFLAGMFLVVLADDALFFLIAWEMMAAASYFLVLFEDERIENRRAAFLYLVVAHVGAIAILLSFGVMAGLATGFTGFEGYTFDAMRETELPAGWATLAFLLAFFGFAAKAGVIPLHVWLPEAHPVAPSNVSALMSGVMLKTAIYGIVRVVFDLIGDFPLVVGRPRAGLRARVRGHGRALCPDAA